MRNAGWLRLISNVAGRSLVRRAICVAPIGAAVAIATALGFSGYGPAISAMSTRNAAVGATMVGRATVIDGDTVEIHGEHVRINGVDAPESRQSCTDGQGRAWRCGIAAAKALDIFLAASRPMRCEYVDRDRYGRFVGNCFRADGKNIAAWLAGNGHALDWPRYSGGAYAAEQARAQAAKAGMWSGTFEAPWDWRASYRNRKPAQNDALTTLLGLVASADCRIKGNISTDGERIYHVPGQRFYSKTRIAVDKGERWFCGEAEATKAGWRRASS